MTTYADPVSINTESPCRACGTAVKAGSGTVLSIDNRVLRSEIFWSSKAVRYDGEPWLRMHSECSELTVADIVRRLTHRSDLCDDEALTALQRSEIDAPLAFRRDIPSATLTAFGFVSRRERKKLLSAVGIVLELTRGFGRPSVQGACSWCGRSRSRAWHEGPHRWSDKSSAPLCAECFPFLGGASTKHEFKVRALMAFSEFPHIVSDEFEDLAENFKCFIDLRPDDRGGRDRAWDYSPGLEAVREELHSRWPERIPDAEQRDFAMTARRMERQLVEAERAEVAAARAAEGAIRW